MSRVAIYVGALVGLLAVVAVVIMAAAGIGIFAVNVEAFTAKKTLRPGITKRVYDPERALAIYQRFRSECRSVVAKTQEIVVQRQRVTELRAAIDRAQTVGQEQAAEAAYQNAVDDFVALKQSRIETAQTYNAQAANFSLAVFQHLGDANGDPPLPYRINPPYDTATCG